MAFDELAELARVAPITGAWIETIYARCQTAVIPVAPITGAWIETPARQEGHE